MALCLYVFHSATGLHQDEVRSDHVVRSRISFCEKVTAGPQNIDKNSVLVELDFVRLCLFKRLVADSSRIRIRDDFPKNRE